MNLQETNPMSGAALTTATATAVIADETALFGTSNTVTTCDVSLSALTAPAAPTVAQVGTAGTTSYSYSVADVGNVGCAPSTVTANTLGNATISATNYNAVTFIGISGHTYNLYRAASSGTPSTTGLIYTTTLAQSSPVPGVGVSVTFNDTGVTPTGGVPTANTSGMVLVAGPSVQAGAFQTISTTAAAALSVANITNGILFRTGGGALTDTFPTAAVLVANFPGAKANSWFKLVYRNGNSGSITLAVTTGGTLTAGNTNAIVSLHAKELFIQLTSVTVGSETFTVTAGTDSAY